MSGAIHRQRGNYKHNSLTTRLERIYTEAPHEWLTLEDLMLKLNCNSASVVKNAIQTLRLHGRINIRALTVYARQEEA